MSIVENNTEIEGNIDNLIEYNPLKDLGYKLLHWGNNKFKVGWYAISNELDGIYVLNLDNDDKVHLPRELINQILNWRNK